MAADLSVGTLPGRLTLLCAGGLGVRSTVLGTVVSVRSNVISFCRCKSHTSVCRQPLIWQCTS